MKQLADIAYVIPATAFIGYWVGNYLEKKYEGEYLTTSILIAAALGFALTVYRIMKYVESQYGNNKKPEEEKSEETN